MLVMCPEGVIEVRKSLTTGSTTATAATTTVTETTTATA
jgi:hypothetical protein